MVRPLLFDISLGVHFIRVSDVSADHYRSATLLLVQLFDVKAGMLQSPLQLLPGNTQLSRRIL